MIVEEIVSKARRARQNVTAFRALVASPAAGSVTMPAGARVAFKATGGAPLGALLATVISTSTRQIHSRGLAANELQVLDNIEQDSRVTVPAGITMYIDAGLNAWQKVLAG